MTGPVTQSKAKKVKFVDDGTVAVSINLKKCLEEDPVTRPRPLNYRERSGHVLPPQNNLLQYYLNDTEKFTEENKMVINSKKSNIILFNKSRKWDFPPEMSFSNNEILHVKNQLKLVGVIISDDLRWGPNTEYICKKATQRLWVLRRMKMYKLDTEHIIDTYTKEVRSLLEMAVPVWHSGLTKKQSRDIERVQKTALYIIFGENNFDYDVACTIAEIEPLEMRREQLCLKFASKDANKANSMFTKVEKSMNTRSNNVVVEPRRNTTRLQNSSIPYLSRLLNQNK